jgi:hypothetical protein
MELQDLGKALATAQTRARVAKWGLGFIAGLSVFMTLSILVDHYVAYQAAKHGEAASDLADLSMMNQGLVVLVNFSATLITAIAFMMWFHAAYKILPGLGATRLEFTPGQAAASFVIPFISLYRPYQVMREIWYSSDPESPDNPVNTPLVLRFWWGLFLLHLLLDRLSPRSMTSGDDLSGLKSYGNIGPDLVSIAAAVVAIFAVRSVMDRQERRVAQLLFPATEGAQNDPISA